MPAYTHDRYGRPLAPSIAHVLNDMAIPRPKRRAASKKAYRPTAFPAHLSNANALIIEKTQYDYSCQSHPEQLTARNPAPNTDAPTRRRRVSCPHLEECASHPLSEGASSETDSGTCLGEAPELDASDVTLSPQTSAESSSSVESATNFLKRALSSVTKDPADKIPDRPDREDRPAKSPTGSGLKEKKPSLLKVSKWLNFFSVSPPRGRGGITLPPPAPPIKPPPAIVDELAASDPELEPAVTPLVTYGVHETPVVHVKPRLARSNPRFLRTLALENSMCEKGKITYPSAQMFLPPRDHRSHECDVLGICTRIDNHRTRQWTELCIEDFDDLEDDDEDDDETLHEISFDDSFNQSLDIDTYSRPAQPDAGLQSVLA